MSLARREAKLEPQPPRIVTLGESMVMLRAGGVGNLAAAKDVNLTVGGAESNVAIGAHRLGVSALWISRLGNDPFGDLIEGTIRGTGVGVLIEHDPERRSGFAVREQRTTERTRVTYYREGSAASAFAAEQLSDQIYHAVAQAEIFHVSGISLAVSPGLRASILELVRHARASGTLVSFDVNHRSTMWSATEARAAYQSLLPSVDVCFAGEEEALLLTGAAPSEALSEAPSEAPSTDARTLCAAVTKLGPQSVIIKRGARGAFASVDGACFEQEAVPVPVIDSVGAGDAFVAGYLAATADGADAATRLDRGVRCGAIACASEGDWEGNPTIAELEQLLDDGDPVLR